MGQCIPLWCKPCRVTRCGARVWDIEDAFPYRTILEARTMVGGGVLDAPVQVVSFLRPEFAAGWGHPALRKIWDWGQPLSLLRRAGSLEPAAAGSFDFGASRIETRAAARGWADVGIGPYGGKRRLAGKLRRARVSPPYEGERLLVGKSPK